MTKYVCGFLFNWDKSKVILIEKLKPEWQKGKINGIGGKIEGDERLIDAMIRETKEEIGLDTHWTTRKVLEDKTEGGEDWTCYFLCGFAGGDPQQMEAEKPGWYNVADLDTLPVIPNLRHIIPAAIALIDKRPSNMGYSGVSGNTERVYKNYDPNADYILTSEIPDNITTTKNPIPKYTVVNNVRVIDDMYNFKVKATGIDEHTYYDGMLVLNTPENIATLRYIEKLDEVVNMMWELKHIKYNELHNRPINYERSVSDTRGEI